MIFIRTSDKLSESFVMGKILHVPDWNRLCLVEKLSLNDTALANYSYLADGTKTSATDCDGNGFLYLGSLIYRRDGNQTGLENVAFDGGRFVVSRDTRNIRNQ